LGAETKLQQLKYTEPKYKCNNENVLLNQFK
jgi:hypothetical protein